MQANRPGQLPVRREGPRENSLRKFNRKMDGQPPNFRLERWQATLLSSALMMFISRIYTNLRGVYLTFLLLLVGTVASSHATPWRFIVFADTQASDWTPGHN